MNNKQSKRTGIAPGVAFAVLAGLMATGCATIISGTNQTLTFTSKPPGAEVYLDGQMIGTTPVSVEVRKNQKNTVMLKKDGYRTVTRDITKSYDNVALLNVFWDLSTTDMISGAAFEYDPNSYYIELSTETGTSDDTAMLRE